MKRVEFEVGYWRKANAIHDWFVRNVQGGVDECDPFDVTREHLAKLLDDCKRVQADHRLSTTLLPPKAGFFFGETDIDQYYFNDIEDTIKIIEPLVQNEDLWKAYNFIYQSSW